MNTQRTSNESDCDQTSGVGAVTTGNYRLKWFGILNDLRNAEVGDFGLDCRNHCEGHVCCPQETNASIIIFLPYEPEFIAAWLGIPAQHLETQWSLQRIKIGLSADETVDIAWTRHCAFLRDGECSIYQFRPFDCRSFPVMSYISEGQDLYFVLARKCPQHLEISELTQTKLEGLWRQLTPEIPLGWWDAMESVVVSNHLASLPRFYPVHAPVPAGIRTSQFFLRPLKTTDVDLDYAALMESRDLLRNWSRSEWPTDDFTLTDNLEDLERHQLEHLDRQAFTFTVLDPDGTRCLGCVYVNPVIELLKHGHTNEVKLAQVGHYEAMVRFWVRQTELAKDLDQRLVAALLPWFRDEWSFSRVVFCVDENDTRQAQILEKAGLQFWNLLDRPCNNGKYKAYL